MNRQNFVTDMAVESAQNLGCEKDCISKELQFGIVQRVLHVKTLEMSRKIGREKGVYVTFDCNPSRQMEEGASKYLQRLLANTIKQLMGTLKKSAPVLVVGLGNGELAADALGDRVASKIKVSPPSVGAQKQRLCAISTGVLGTTGIQSAQIVSAIVQMVKPSFVLLVDSLATATVSRLGTSYQISTAGIAPGSGVGEDKQKIDKSVLQVPVLAIGVPMMLSMSTLLTSFVSDFVTSTGAKIDEHALRERMSAKGLCKHVVAPKNTEIALDFSSSAIAGAINSIFEN